MLRKRKEEGLAESGRSRSMEEISDIKGDEHNVVVLLLLYLLQGIPLGLTAAIPMILQNRGASYKQQVKMNNCYIFLLGGFFHQIDKF